MAASGVKITLTIELMRPIGQTYKTNETSSGQMGKDLHCTITVLMLHQGMNLRFFTPFSSPNFVFVVRQNL